MIQIQEQISLRRQCELLAVGRSGLYYEPVGTSAEELALMRRIDEIHLEWPFYGSRKLCETLRIEGTVVNRKHMQRLMRMMGLESVAPKPDTSKPHPEHPVFPYLLRNLAISQPNQVWATDISVPQISGVKDEGRSLAIGLQEQIANHCKRLGSKALVVSVAEKVP
jgi:putative transposase